MVVLGITLLKDSKPMEAFKMLFKFKINPAFFLNKTIILMSEGEIENRSRGQSQRNTTLLGPHFLHPLPLFSLSARTKYASSTRIHTMFDKVKVHCNPTKCQQKLDLLFKKRYAEPLLFINRDWLCVFCFKFFQRIN